MKRFRLLFLLLLAMLPAAAADGGAIHHRSRWLTAEGRTTRFLVSDTDGWLEARESFIRKQAVAFRALAPALPVVYHLDEDFVAAARVRKSLRVVDDCRDDHLCGVATDELVEEWEAADIRAMFTSSETPAPWRDAFAAALRGRFEGDDVDALAADILRADLRGDPRDAANDPRVAVPLLASLIRFADPKHLAPLGTARLRVARLSEADMTRWRNARVNSPGAIQRGLAANAHGRAQGGSSRSRPAPKFLHGATLSVVNRIESSTIANGSRDEIERLHTRGFDTLVLVPFGGQRGFSGSEIRRFDSSPAGETDLAMRLPAARAHRLGMQVMLKPHVWPSGGAVDPTQIEPSNWTTWFASYERFLVHEALLARSMRAEWLVIGTELNRTERRPEWGRLIRVARALFPGQLIYAANFDSFERTPFWSQLDAIGVDAYFPLSQRKDATDADLRAGAASAVARLDAVAARAGMPVIVTELGYSLSGSPWVQPWDATVGTSDEESDQARAFDAFLGAVTRSRSIRGFVVWKYESGVAPWREAFVVKGRKAEQVIERYLK